MLSRKLTIAVTLVCFMVAGCVAPNVKLFTDATDPLKEFVLEGEAKEKILIIPIKGIISDSSKKGMLQSEPGMVQDIVSQLAIAEKDTEIKAVIFTIDSPGGSVTASDILYHEIMRYKEKSGAKVTAVLMNVAASGGYYVALPADYIMAHPTSVTGSIGVIFMRPGVSGLMEKAGVGGTVSIFANGYWQVWQKLRRMARSRKSSLNSFAAVNDLISFRLVVDSEDKHQCYTLLGEINSFFGPYLDNDRFDDFIAYPQNGYRAIQVTARRKHPAEAGEGEILAAGTARDL